METNYFINYNNKPLVYSLCEINEEYEYFPFFSAIVLLLNNKIIKKIIPETTLYNSDININANVLRFNFNKIYFIILNFKV